MKKPKYTESCTLEKVIEKIVKKYPWRDSKELFRSELEYLIELVHKQDIEQFKSMDSMKKDKEFDDETREKVASLMVSQHISDESYSEYRYMDKKNKEIKIRNQKLDEILKEIE